MNKKKKYFYSLYYKTFRIFHLYAHLYTVIKPFYIERLFKNYSKIYVKDLKILHFFFTTKKYGHQTFDQLWISIMQKSNCIKTFKKCLNVVLKMFIVGEEL